MRSKNLLRSSSVIVLAAVMAMAFALGCAEEAPTPTQTPTEPAKRITWKVQGHYSQSLDLGKREQLFADALNERGGDLWEIQFFPTYGLVKGANLLPSIKAGDIQAGLGPTMYYAGEVPALATIDLPFLARDVATASLVHDALYPIYNEQLREAFGAELLAVYSSHKQIMFSNKELSTLEDFEGMLIRASNPIVGQAIEALGATTAYIDFNEVYVAMQRGTIDGFVTGFPTLDYRAFWEVTEWVTPDLCWTSTGAGLFVSQDAYETLPDELKIVLLEESRSLEKDMRKLTELLQAYCVEFAKDKGVNVGSITPEVETRMYESASVIWQQWVDSHGEMEKQAADLAMKVANVEARL